MAVLIQIILVTLASYSVTSSPIFGEFTWKKNIDVGFKPIPFKPIAFIKEAWSPFGIFGVKHGIVKREVKPKLPIHDLSELLKVIPLKPITFIKEKWTPFGVFGEKHGFVKRDLDQIVPPEKPLEPAPAHVNMPETSLLSRLPAGVYEEEEPKEIAPAVIEVTPVPKFGPLEPMHPPPSPVQAPPPPAVVISPPPVEKEPFEGLNTNIGRDEDIGNYLSAANEDILPFGNSIVPEKPKVGIVPLEKQDNLIVRGSKLAFDLGALLLEIFSQFLGRGKFA